MSKKIIGIVLSIIGVVLIVIVGIVGVNHVHSVHQKNEAKQVITQFKASVTAADKRLSPKFMAAISGNYTGSGDLYNAKLKISGDTLTVTNGDDIDKYDHYTFKNISLLPRFFLDAVDLNNLDISKVPKKLTADEIAKLKKATRIVNQLDIKGLLDLGDVKYTHVPILPYTTLFYNKEGRKEDSLVSVYTSDNCIGISASIQGDNWWDEWFSKD